MAANLRFIVDAAQGNARHFAVHALGNGIRDGSLADAGRADQAQDLGWHFRGHLPYGNGLKDTFLYLLKAVVVLIQYLLDCGNIHLLLGFHIPGKFQDGVQIIA